MSLVLYKDIIIILEILPLRVRLAILRRTCNI